MEIHVSRGLTIIVLKKLSDLKQVGTGLKMVYANIVMKLQEKIMKNKLLMVKK